MCSFLFNRFWVCTCFFDRPFTIQSPSQPLAGENRGRQMLERMGWSGLGLGAKEQGEVEPVGVGDVRVDRADHFRGTLRGPHFVVL